MPTTTMALTVLPVLAPTLTAVAAATGRRARWTDYAAPVSALVILGTGLALAPATLREGPMVWGVLRADPLAAYLLAVVGAVAATATWAGMAPRSADSRPDGWFAALTCLFEAAMAAALVADNLGVMWVAIEATTIATAFLVGFRADRPAVEAAWKYVVLGSVGVAVALLGIVLLYAATGSAHTLSWTALVSGSVPLDGGLTRVATALTALGLATKAGLAPMHSWLPDAHSQAPAPVSGLMSGVLLSVAFSGILRIQTVSDSVLGPGSLRVLLLTAGLASLAVAAVLVLTQRDYKRLLAYSSIEHMGLLALGAAIGSPLALGAVLLHMLGHGLAKAGLFVVAGRILAAEGSARISDVRSLLTRRPALAVPFLVGMVALLGFPPFGLFVTELAIVYAGWRQGLGWAMAVALVLLLVVFAGLARHTLAMALTGPDGESHGSEGGSHGSDEQVPPHGGRHGYAEGPVVPLVLALGTVALLGVAVWPLLDVLTGATTVLTGGLP
jgi:hydrogenase-4 component F